MAKKQKKRVATPVRVPVTQGFVDEIGRELHFALMGMEMGDGSVSNWTKAGRVLLVLSMASDDNERVWPTDKKAVDAAVTALDQMSRRCLGMDKWEMTNEERNALHRGVLGAESMLPCLDSRAIQRAQAYADLLEVS